MALPSRLLRAAAAALAALCSLAAPAQEYPNRPIRLIVGPGPDLLARIVGEKLQAAWGQPVVVDQRPAAGGVVAGDSVAKAPPDGYTLLTADNAVLVFNPVLYRKLGYDPVRDFQPIGLMARFPLILAVHPGSGITSAQQWLEVMRKSPGQYSYASPGVGTPHHMAMELIKQRLGLFIVHVPYRGAAPAVQDVAGGQVPMMVVESAGGLPMIRAGKLKPLAVFSARRMPVLPDVPTFAELGVKNLEVYAWQGVVVPKATPKPIADRLSAELQKAVAHPDVKRKLVEFGMEVNPSDATLMATYTAMETSLWQPLIKQRGIRAD